MSRSKYDLEYITSQFCIEGRFVTADHHGSGHINDTFLVTYENEDRDHVQYVFQRINHDVFKNPPAVMENIERVTNHQKLKQDQHGLPSRSLTFMKTTDDKLFSRDKDGNYWRGYTFVDNVRTFNVVERPDQAYQAAKAFGEFQKNLVDLPGERLHETIPDFHNTPMRYHQLEHAIENDLYGRVKDVQEEIEFAMERKEIAHILIELQQQGHLPERITHNDTKLNNVLICDKTGKGVCVIDLDTVMPGLVLYDFGDLVRTGTCSAAEDEANLSLVKMRLPYFEAIVKGYLSTAGEFLTDREKEYLVFSGKLITLQLGIRFLTDHLNGDKYFKTHRDNHNLDRCRNQFKLVESIEEQESEMKAIVQSHI